MMASANLSGFACGPRRKRLFARRQHPRPLPRQHLPPPPQNPLSPGRCHHPERPETLRAAAHPQISLLHHHHHHPGKQSRSWWLLSQQLCSGQGHSHLFLSLTEHKIMKYKITKTIKWLTMKIKINIIYWLLSTCCNACARKGWKEQPKRKCMNIINKHANNKSITEKCCMATNNIDL